MNAALERLRERNTAQVKLEDGDLLVTLQLPAMRECILAGGIPLPMLEKVAKLTEDAPRVDTEILMPHLEPDEVNAFDRFQRILVAKTVKAIEGEELEEEMTPEETSVFSDAQFYEIVAYAMREKPLPGKA
jgi:hypothetical protein